MAFLSCFFLIAKSQTIQITNCTDFQNIQNNLTADYIILNDIDCSNISNFAPIGSNAFPFKGTLNGNDRTIANITIEVLSAADEVGIFGFLENANIINIVLEDFSLVYSLDGSSKVGALCGSISNSNVSNIRLRTSSYSKKNLLSLPNSISTVGSVIGMIDNSNVDNITVENTQIIAHLGSPIGGLFGVVTTSASPISNVTNCHNLGKFQCLLSFFFLLLFHIFYLFLIIFQDFLLMQVKY